MGLFSRRGIIDRIKFDGKPEQVIWKFPHDNLTTMGQLIVNQSQQVIFCKEGAYLDTFGPGTHTLDTSNIPLLQSLVNLPFGSKTPFTAEVWYINCKVYKENLWGTPSPIRVKDPEFGFIIPIRAFGQYSFKIVDSKKFMEEIVGTDYELTTEDIQDKFKAPLISKITDALAEMPVEQKISVLDMPAKIDELSEECKSRIQQSFNNFGVELVELFIESINYQEDDPSVAQLNEAYANKARRAIEGTTYAQERTFDVLNDAASNESSANIGMGMGIGNSMGNIMGNMMNNLASNNQPTSTPPPLPNEVAFHVSINGQQSGPYNTVKLEQMIRSGQINQETYVWKQGLVNWIKAREAQELLSLFVPNTPPPAP